jgi:hypothetical protein
MLAGTSEWRYEENGMLRQLLTIVWVMGLISCAESAPTGTIALRASLTEPIQAGRHSEVRVTVQNMGASPITLVRPGDGSRAGRRTPRVAWLVEPVSTFTSAPAWPSPTLHGLCGHINGLRADEVVTLRPGETFDYVQPVFVENPGRHVVAVYYRNEPGIRWSGRPWPDHDPSAMRAVQSSNPAQGRAELIVDVAEPVAISKL